MFDLNLFPLHFAAGREMPDLPGLLAEGAPRRAERHRSGDLLVGLLAPYGQKTGPDDSAGWFQGLSSVYFSTPGTVTSALRAAVEQLHQRLLGQSVAVASIAVIRNNLLYLVTCGPAHAFLVNPSSIQDLTDAGGGWQGLGASRTINLRFFQAELQPGDMLLLTVEPPAAWTVTALSGHRFPAPEILRRRLLALCSTDFKAGIIQVQEGKGQIQVMRRGSENHPAPPPEASPLASSTAGPVTAEVSPRPRPVSPGSAHSAPAQDGQPPRPVPASPEAAAPATATPTAPARPPLEITPRPRPIPIPPAAQVSAPEPEAQAQPETDTSIASRARERMRARQTAPAAPRPGFFARLFARRPAKPAAETILLSTAPAQEAQSTPVIPVSQPVRETHAPAQLPEARPDTPLASTPPSEPAAEEARSPAGRNWLKALAALIRGTRTVQQSAGRGVSRVIPRVLPGKPAQQPAPVSTATMIFIAVAVPVVIAAAAVTVYYRQGASEERVAFLQQARIYADQAGKQKDATLRRGSWEQTLYWIDKAEDYGKDEESQALRRKAQIALDSIDGIVRMSLVPAFSTTLGSQVNITSLAATSDDLYILDSNTGRVLHMNLVGRTYEFDSSFNCGPGPEGGIIIGPLVGMATLPPGNQNNAAVVAIDATGNLLYCILDEPPLAQTLKRPDNNWGRITGMTLGGGNLFVLDVPNNVVYRYDGNNYIYEGQPRLFFGDVVPNLNDVIDLRIYQDDLYLLRSNGKITLCTWSAFDFAPTRCTDPAPYGDARKSKEIKSFAGASFIKMITTQPPDPSLYILDAQAPSVYHFSLRLNLQRQLRQDADSDFPFPDKPVTAFAITSTRQVFVAFGNQIYYGPLP